jgi:RNA-binding protein
MPELTLSQSQRLSLRAKAHQLDPVVLVGSAGLSEAVLKEIDRALRAHGLIKVKVALAEREDREFMYQTIADRLHAARIQVIGHTFVLYRPVPEDTKTAAPAPMSKPRKAPAKHAAGRSRSDAAPTRRISDKRR